MTQKIFCPRPTRPLKRNIFEDPEQPATKRQRLGLFDLAADYHQSDGLLKYKMSDDLDIPSKRIRRIPARYDPEPARRAPSAPLLKSYQPPSHPSLPERAPSAPITMQQPQTVPDRRYSSATLTISSPLVTPISSPATSFFNTDDSRDSRTRVKSPTYRGDLSKNGIHISPYPQTIPQSVQNLGHKIMTGGRKSPGLSEDQIAGAVKAIYDLKDADEDTIRAELASAQLLPSATRFQGTISIGSSLPFDYATIPHVSGAPPVVTPKPDRLYALDREAFSVEEDQKLIQMRPYSKPSTAGYFPFFAVEFKSQARGGTEWVAANQNAASGAACVSAVKRLISYVEDTHTEIASISFSCCVDGQYASFWTHWCQDDKFFSAKLKRYDLAEDIVLFRNTMLNIVEFGINKRLPQIKSRLAQIALPDLQFQEKSRRARKPSNG